MTPEHLIKIFFFLFVAGGFFYIYLCVEAHVHRMVTIRRLSGTTGEKGSYQRHLAETTVKKMLMALGNAAVPKKKSEISALRRKLGHAGYRSQNAPVIYFGTRLGLSLMFAGLFFVSILAGDSLGPRELLYGFFPLAAGYFLPKMILADRIKRRHRQIFQELPDTLDLLLICMEAGLSFDMALYRVSRELAAIAPVLSAEFGQYFLEIKGGLPRREVLENLARRNGEKSLSSVVQVLIQSSRFGTDIAEAMRVYSETLRLERKRLAEEKGAKISTKLTFPTVLLILPAMMLIILGPAAINLVERLK
jgi:tight adherence protein C